MRGDLTDPAACAPRLPESRSSFTVLRRSAIGEGGASFRPVAWTRPEHSPRPRPALASIASSISARPAPMAIPADQQAPIDETAPLGQNVWVLDYYTRSKVDCERSLWQMAEAGDSP